MAGQLIDRGNRTWMVRVYDGTGANGKRKYVNRTVHGNKKDAERVLTALLREKDLDGIVQQSRGSLSDHLDTWLETVAKGRVRERTLDDYRSIIDRYVKPNLGGLPLSKLSAADIQKLYSQFLARGLSAQTVRHIHAVTNSALNQAVRWKLISFNPCQSVDLPQVQRKEMHALSPEEAKRFLAAAQTDRWAPLFTLLINTGLRPSEALALRWMDIDLNRGQVTVQRTLAGRAGRWRIEDPKTPRSRRKIPMSESVTQLLRDRKRAIEEKDPDLAGDLCLAFGNDKGLPLELKNLSARNFKPILKAAKLPKTVRLYDLRHTCATLLLSAGVNPKIVSERLGHASIMLTLDTYSHVLPDMQQSAADELEKMLFSVGKA